MDCRCWSSSPFWFCSGFSRPRYSCQAGGTFSKWERERIQWWNNSSMNIMDHQKGCQKSSILSIMLYSAAESMSTGSDMAWVYGLCGLCHPCHPHVHSPLCASPGEYTDTITTKNMGENTTSKLLHILTLASLTLLLQYCSEKNVSCYRTIISGRLHHGQGNCEYNQQTTTKTIFILCHVVDHFSQIQNSPSLITWRLIETKMCWGVIFLLGGGFALANASQVTI